MIVKFIKSKIKQLKCKHTKLKFITNFHGDMINYKSRGILIYRSEYRCKLCGKTVYSENLNKEKSYMCNYKDLRDK